MMRGLVAALCVVALAGGPAPLREPLTVSAAISLTDVLEALGKAYEAANGDRVTFNFGGSNVLARQVVNGAPVDVFISADVAQMDLVERAGLVRPGSRVPIVGNRLALVASGRTRTVSSVQALAQPEVRRIAIGDSAAVPAGVYTKAYLERIGLWNRLQPKLLPAGNVRAALAAVQNGAADAAFVYVTDARGVPGVRIVSVIEGADAPQIVYPACIVASTRRPDAAARFVAFLRTATALGVFEGYGFMPLRTP